MYTASIQENMQVWKILVFSHEAAKDEAVDLPVNGCIRELESSARHAELPETWIQRAAQSLHQQALVDYAQDFTYITLFFYSWTNKMSLLYMLLKVLLFPYHAQYFTSRSQFHSVLQVQL